MVRTTDGRSTDAGLSTAGKLLVGKIQDSDYMIMDKKATGIGVDAI